MGFLDSASTMINRGVASAGRSTKSLTLKAQIKELQEKRTAAAAQLGASLFEETRANAALRNPREALYAAIESIDGQCAALQQELDTIERQSQIAAAPTPGLPCRVCGAPVAPGDLFCTNCGTKVEAQSAPAPAPAGSQRTCVKCGTALGPDDRFCMNCGTPAASAPQPAAVPEPTDAQPVPEVPGSDPTQTTSVFSRDGAPSEGETSLDDTPPEGETSLDDTPRNVIPSEGGEAAAVEGSHAASAGQAPDEGIEEPAAPVPSAQPAPFPAVPSFTSVLASDPNKTLPIEDLVGAPIGQQAGLCPHCGYENVPEAAFCHNCGQRL